MTRFVGSVDSAGGGSQVAKDLRLNRHHLSQLPDREACQVVIRDPQVALRHAAIPDSAVRVRSTDRIPPRTAF